MDILSDWITTICLIAGSPLPNTFITESKKAKGKFVSALMWLVLAVFVINVYDFFVRGIFSVSLFLFTALLIPVDFLFFVFCINMLHMRLYNKKKDCYDELLYLIVAIFVLFIFVFSLFSQAPILGELISWAILIYAAVLTVLAVKSVTQLEFGHSIVVVSLSLILAVGGFFCFPAFFASIMQAVPSVLR